MLKDFVNIISLLDDQKRRKAIWLSFFILFVTFFDILGIASVLPISNILLDPEIIDNNDFLQQIYTVVKNSGLISDIDEFRVLIFICFLLVFVSSIFAKAVIAYIQTHFTFGIEFDVSRKLLRKYLNFDYSFFLNRNSSELGKNILSEVDAVIQGSLLPLVTIFAQGIALILLLSLLLFVNPSIALIILTVLILVYSLLIGLMSGILKRIGRSRVESNEIRYKLVSEIFGAIKEVKFANLEKVYFQAYDRPGKQYAKSRSNSIVFAQMPRFFVEILAFGGVFLTVFFAFDNEGDIGDSLPLFSLYAFAGYRIMPSIQQIYSGLTSIRLNQPALNSLIRELTSKEIILKDDSSISKSDSINFNDSILLEKITFTYPENRVPTLKNISLKIQKNKVIGFVGSTGSGKTTLIDVIIGLIKPDSGHIFVDNKKLSPAQLDSFRLDIGYVSQHIFLTDSDIASNIAFGTPEIEVDYEKVANAAKVACIYDFIVNELPLGFKTQVGEKGVRLSGGQRQRIGIARAIYRNPKLLILDEATSALDNITESKVLKNILSNSEITIIMIAHRLSTVEKCDSIYFIDYGKIIEEGTYSDLLSGNSKFKELVQSADEQ